MAKMTSDNNKEVLARAMLLDVKLRQFTHVKTHMDKWYWAHNKDTSNKWFNSAQEALDNYLSVHE
jgi:hypothetical protein